MDTILYIDDQDRDLHRLQRALDGQFEVKTINPRGIAFQELMVSLKEKDFDYLIVDYRLNNSGCGYDGDEIAKAFSREFPHFPLMLLTTHENGALEEVAGFDLTKIRPKKDIGKETFPLLIRRQIEKYNNDAEEKATELEQLIDRRQSGVELNAEEEDNLLKLDVFLEEVLGIDSPDVPEHLRHPSNDAKITALLNKTDALIAKLERYEDLQK